MRVKTLLAVGALGFSSLLVAVPTANASATPDVLLTAGESVDYAATVDADGNITMDNTLARPICKGSFGPRYHTARCRRAAPGTQFRAMINCTNTGWRYGPWRNQTRDFSTKSTIRCGDGGGVREALGIDFR